MTLSLPPRIVLLATALAISQGPVTRADSPTETLAGQGVPEQVRTFLQQHCVECHSGEKPKAKFRVDSLADDLGDRAEWERWQKVLKRVSAGEMPPQAKPRPAEKDVAALTDWIAAQTAAARRAAGRVVLRRLNRAEYENTVRDLLGVQVNLKELLAQDGALDGFDNVGAALHLSSFGMERYLDATDAALNLAIVNQPAPPTQKVRYSLKDSHAVTHKDRRPFFRVLDDAVVCFTSIPYTTISLSQFYPNHRGDYRVRVSASGFQSAGKPVSFQAHGETAGLIGYFDVPADEPTVREFVTRIEARTGFSLLPYGLDNGMAVHKIGADNFTGPGLAIQWIEVEGPLYESWPPPSHRRIFGDLPQERVQPGDDRLEVVSKDPQADAERILRTFARRAFRRSVTDDDLKPYFAMVKASLADGDSFEQAVRVGLTAILLSPRFLFLDEKPGPLDDFALASRLSYFLWSTMPDEELLVLAEQGRLREAETLRGQVERMLNSPQAAAFVSNFCGQWLALRDIDATSPNNFLYPEFDELLKVSMVRETELFFTELLRNDLSVMNLVASDFSMLNGRLARHYGIPGVDGLWEFGKVPLPADSHRGGVLTMASVLKVTANGASTSPVTRGVWVLERILGTPPPRPPADVPPLEPDIRGATTIREQLAKHREIGACAACHSKIDPPGFALESFDVIGNWRDYYRVTPSARVAKEIPGQHYLQGHDVDATGEMADGQKFQNIDEFKQLLLKDKDQIARALTVRLATYATGGAPEPADGPEIEAIVARVRAKDFGLRTLVHEVVQSRMFREK